MCNKNSLNEKTKEDIKKIIFDNKNKKGAIMIILHKVQEIIGYIPYEAQEMISIETKISMAEIYGIVTFYSRFTLEPVGKFKIGVCLGTACYVKGSEKLLNKVEEILKIKAGETTSNGLFSIDATRCIGACGLAPVITVNKDVYGKLGPEQIHEILLKYSNIE